MLQVHSIKPTRWDVAIGANPTLQLRMLLLVYLALGNMLFGGMVSPIYPLLG